MLIIITIITTTTITTTRKNNDDQGGLFAEINQGTDITRGLKNVTADMKTKNKPNRSGKVPEAPLNTKDTKVQAPKNDAKKKKKNHLKNKDQD